ncbi:MAG TPA: CPBP family glutamic-type intramembrane protease [Sphingomonas sp.]|nr:CPBP family glutamic-type intramembrane protease [Sphingomonas sp.]
MINALISAAVQVGAVLVVAALVYALFGKRSGFRRYIGLTPATAVAAGAGVLWGIVPALVLIASPGIRAMAGGDNSVVGEIATSGLTPAIALALAIKALLQTSLSEELLFRGLIGKRLIARFGFAAGNGAQAVLFGLMHLLLLFIPQASPPLVLAMVAITGIMGWVNGWLNERLGNGSIVPGWIAHGLTNLIAYLSVAYFG